MEKTQKWKLQFMTVALGQAVSMLGSHGVQFALIWWLAEKTSSPLMLGISGLVAYLPMTLFSPLAGIAADRYNRKFISIFSDMAMGTVALIYAVLLFFFDLPVWTVFVMLCARGIGSTFQQPAIQSIIPQLVPKDQLVKTNGWMQLLNAGSFLLGPVIGASLYAIFPMSIVLMSDVAGAILASIALAVVKIPELEKAEREERQKEVDAREQIREKNELCIINCVNASLALGEATARAVQRIPDAHCNGDMHAALDYAQKVKHEQKDFLNEQALKQIV